MAFCQSCGAAVPENVSFCGACGRAQPGTPHVAAPPATIIPEKYGMAALLSFLVPGLGQIIKGQIAKALLIWLGLGVFFGLSFVLVGLPFLVVLWFWQIYDAYDSPQVN